MHTSTAKIDIIFTTTTEVLLLKNKGEQLKIVLVLDYSSGADAIIVQRNIRSIVNLKNKTVALKTGSILHFLLLDALHKNHLGEEDITILNTSTEKGIDMFLKKEVDAIVSWPPYIYQAMAKGGHVVYSSKNIPGEIVDTLSIRESFLKKHREECVKFIIAYLNTIEWSTKHLDEGNAIINKSYKSRIENFKNDITNIQLTGPKENQIAFGTAQKPEAIYIEFNQLMQFFVDQKVIASPINTNQLIDHTLFLEYEKQYENNSK